MKMVYVPVVTTASNVGVKKNDANVDIPQCVTRIYGNRNRMQ